MNKLLKLVSFGLPLLVAAILLVIFSFASPIAIGPLGVLMVFGLLYLLFASSFFIVLHWGLMVSGQLVARRRPINPRRWRLGERRAYYIASVLAFGPVMLLALNSVGQLKLQDVTLVTVLLALAVFYISKRA